nr:ladderlectin-like isoform X1 [Procambarus clarkii]
MTCLVLFALLVLGIEAENLHPSSGCVVNQILCPQYPNGSLSSGGEAPCLYPYKRAGDVCLYLSKSRRTWSGARRHCQGLGGDLATSRRIYLLQTFITEGGAATTEVWVGGKESPDGKTWQWIDNGEEIDPQVWHPTLPGARAGDNDCAYLSDVSHPPLANYPCGRAYNFLCQQH